jgi:hypothetical protein
MVLPEPIEPDTPEPAPEAAKRAPDPPASDRPDWLVGAEEGVEHELKRKGLEASGAPVELRRPEPPVDLRRPEPPAEDVAPARVGLPLPRMTRPDAASTPEPAKDKKPEAPVPWKGAGTSVPKLRLASVAEPPSSAPELSRKRSGAAADEDEAFEPDSVPAGPMAGGSFAAEAKPAAVGAPSPVKVQGLNEPWWLIVGERLATDRKLQLIVGGGIAVVLALTFFWPHGENSVSISALHKHPERFEGQTVRVRGRVGEVFPVGQGHAFYLHSGRDTLVIYTRSNAPESRRTIEVVGSVTMGYLDGAPRVAVFATGS